MRQFPASIIAYTLTRSSGRIRLSQAPETWPLESTETTVDDLFRCFEEESADIFRQALEDCGKDPSGSVALLIDKNGIGWAFTAGCNEGQNGASGAFVSMASHHDSQQLREILDRLPSLIWYKDDKNNILTVNQSAAASVGLSVDKVEGRNTADLFPDMADIYLQDDLDVIQSGVPRLGYIERLAPLGHEDKWLRTDKIPFRNPVTGRTGVIAASTDVTQIVGLERENRELNRRLLAASDASGIGLWEHQYGDPVSIWWSPGMFKILGIEADEPLGREAFMQLVHPDDRDTLEAALKLLLESADQQRVEFRIRHAEGHYIWIESDGRAERAKDGTVLRIVGASKDIDARKRTELELKDYTARLESANEKLDSFAYIASHDLKAPLRGMGNLVTWLEEDLPTAAKDTVQDTIDLLRGRLTRMEALLNDLRLYSHAGRQSDTRERIDLPRFLPSLLDLLDTETTVDLALEPNLPMLLLPESAARHVFLNILSNAAKHATKSDVTVRVSAAPSRGGVTISMEDDGPGIEAQYRERVFLPFKTLKPRDDTEGSGIGLSIVRKMMDSFGGRIWVDEPVHGSGARIVMYFPVSHVVETQDTVKRLAS